MELLKDFNGMVATQEVHHRQHFLHLFHHRNFFVSKFLSGLLTFRAPVWGNLCGTWAEAVNISFVTLDHMPLQPIKLKDPESYSSQCFSVLLLEYCKAGLLETKNIVAEISRQANSQKHHSPGEKNDV